MNRQIGRYELLQEIGVGGAGAVYRARDNASGRVVALKQLSAAKSGAKRGMLRALFEREYYTLARLQHPRIIEVYDYGVDSQGPYYTMELLDGADLLHLAPLPFREACKHLRDIASSLALMHSHRLCHRDVTPRNVRLTADGRAKLIDFGALSAFGTAPQVIGTPPCVAPEALRVLPLDQRTDLYALGATAYWALTAQLAYPARNLSELESLWETPPAPPSHFAPDVPPELDALVLSLLSIDPLARPSSAAQVIDALTKIADLDPTEQEQTAESYLSSGPIVGRMDELRWLEQRMARASSGHGTAFLIEGPTGIGKTRLIQEFNVRAQVGGAIVLRADAEANARPFGVAVALALQLVDALPEQAQDAAGAAATLLAHLSPELAAKLRREPMGMLPEDPGERRARLQNALHDWFISIATGRTLVLSVDNLQSADDNSAAFLAALGLEAHKVPLVLIITQRTGEEPVAPIPTRALRKQSACLKLGGLSALACHELVGALFGHAPNAARFAALLFDKSAGNPQHCMDLARFALKRGLVKYMSGSWVLPADVTDVELPDRLDELLDEQFAALPPTAQGLCEALSVHAKRVPIERCLRLCEGMSEAEVYLALDQLVTEQILVLEDASYGFKHNALRASVLARLDDERRRALNLNAASQLLADDPTIQSRVDAAWFLLNAGEDERGANLITDAARAFLHSHGVEDVEQVVRAIEAALEIYEKQGRSKYEIARLLFPLVALGFFIDWRVTLKHGERAIDLGLDITGFGLAGRLSRFLPGKLAVGFGLLAAFVRFGWQRLRGLKYSLMEAIEGFCGLIPMAIGTQNIVFDLYAVQRYTEKLRPMRLLGERQITTLMYDFAWAQCLLSSGREGEARDVLERLYREFPDPAIKKALGEAHWKALYGGILFSLGAHYPYEFGHRALSIADEMEALGVRVWAMAAEEVRMLYHAFRGETEEVQRHRDRVELFAVQGSTTWQAEIFWPLLLLDSEARCGHTLGVRTIVEQISRRTTSHSTLRIYGEVAKATHKLLRGEYPAAVALYEEVIQSARREPESIGWQPLRAAFGYAVALNQLGEHERAKKFSTELLVRGGPDANRIVGHYLESRRQLALAEAGLGDYQEAVRQLDSLLVQFGEQDQPMLIGLLHKARAEVALMMSDAATFERHFADMDKRFRAAKNPSLIAQSDRLAAAAVDAGLRQARTSLRAPRSGTSNLQRAAAEVSSALDRDEAALRLIVQACAAQNAYLYRRSDPGLKLSAATRYPPPAEAQELVLRAVTRAQHMAAEHDNMEGPSPTEGTSSAGEGRLKTVYVESSIAPPESGEKSRYRALVLSTRQNGRQLIVGGALVEVDQKRAVSVDTDLLESIAAALNGSTGDATTNERALALSVTH